MAELRRIIISVPYNLLQEIDGIIALEKCNRSEFIRHAMRAYIDERKKRDLRDRMRRGYVEMSEINLKLAEEGMAPIGGSDSGGEIG